MSADEKNLPALQGEEFLHFTVHFAELVHISMLSQLFPVIMRVSACRSNGLMAALVCVVCVAGCFMS